jgi:hypothetical protein
MDVIYWITSVKDDENADSRTLMEDLVGKRKMFALGHRTPGRTKWKSGDWVCFYAAGKGVVGYAMMTCSPFQLPQPLMRARNQYTWAVKLDNINLHFDKPVVPSPDLRAKLDLFKGKSVFGNWAWFVQATREVSKHDFDILTGQP